jgi:lipoprotein-anchoring transpeptidase ErfK/SrfK
VNSSGNVIDSDAEAGDPVPRGARFVGAPMPYWMRLTGGGVGMHAGHIPNPGSPASHGCIRLPRGLAPKLYDVVDVGTKVIVTRDAPASVSQAHLASND